MKRILVPTDFSPTAEKALRFAVNIASKSKGTVMLYHVYQSINMSTSVDLDKTGKQLNAQTEIDLNEKLQRLIKEIVTNNDHLTVNATVGNGSIINNILKFTEKNNIDLIVMGTQGVNGLKKVVMGSVASGIGQKSEIPILLIPEKFEWKDPQQIVFATDYQRSDRQSLALVIDFAKYYNAEVTVVHLLIAKNKQQAQQGQITLDSYADTAKRRFRKSNLKFQLIESTNVIDTMEHLDTILTYDMLAMVRRNKSFLERFFLRSFTQNMAYLTRQPLLLIPEQE